MEKNEFKNTIRNLVHQVYKGPQEKLHDPFEKYGDFSNFPELKSIILTLMTVDFPNFVSSIDWVAPKPTTFVVTLMNQEYFFLIFNKRGWTVMVEGKKYYIMNLDEENQASDAISRLLYYSNALGDTNEDDSDWEEKSKSKSSSNSSSSSSSGSDWDGGGEDETPADTGTEDEVEVTDEV